MSDQPKLAEDPNLARELAGLLEDARKTPGARIRLTLDRGVSFTPDRLQAYFEEGFYRWGRINWEIVAGPFGGKAA